MKKILYITNGINGSGGLERVLSIKASFLIDIYKYDITIMTLNEENISPFYEFNAKIKFVSIKALGNPIVYFLDYRNGIQDLVNNIDPDIISVCDDGLKGFFLPDIIRTKAKWIYERHASIKLNIQNNILGKFKGYLMRNRVSRFDKFVVLSNSNIDEWKAANVIAISNPISFSVDKGSLLDERKVIAVGSHSYNKGYDTLLKIWKKLEREYPEWELHIYGQVDKECTFKILSEKLNLKNVFFHNPVTNIREKYLESSIMVLPSRSEGFGMVLIEAMECGIPCVSFDCPSGPRDIINHNIDGFLVEDQDEDSFGKAIESLILNDELRKKFGKNAKKNVERFSLNAILNQWHELFKTI